MSSFLCICVWVRVRVQVTLISVKLSPHLRIWVQRDSLVPSVLKKYAPCSIFFNTDANTDGSWLLILLSLVVQSAFAGDVTEEWRQTIRRPLQTRTGHVNWRHSYSLVSYMVVTENSNTKFKSGVLLGKMSEVVQWCDVVFNFFCHFLSGPHN